MKEIIIARDFSDSTGARYITDGEFSGEEFRIKILLPKYLEALEAGEELLVDLDGAYGYAKSFIEEAFGGLARERKGEDILKILRIKSDDQPSWKEKIIKYVKEANKK
ncbi:MAG: STAS-like domain-containing protein [Clostridia bacterium]|nr:STAS-like domain-containing protein [Clostridia bacterium]